MKQELEKVIADFESATGYKLEIRDERPYYSGSLDLEYCTGITSLPDGLTVEGSLNLAGTGITSLPEGLIVGGSLNLYGTGITSLPDGLAVGGGLYLRGTGITSLSKGLTIGESIYLRDTGITGMSNVTWTLSAKDRKKNKRCTKPTYHMEAGRQGIYHG